jgi:hypothetical protein
VPRRLLVDVHALRIVTMAMAVNVTMTATVIGVGMISWDAMVGMKRVWYGGMGT